MKSLTKEEVQALDVGTRVYVKWSGGNGPFWYVIGADKWGNRTINMESKGGWVVDYVSNAYIGLKAPFTIVEVEEDE